MIGLLLFLAIALGAKAPARDDDTEPARPSPSAKSGLEMVRELADMAGMTKDQADFLAFVAYGESGLKPNVGLGDPALFPAGTEPNTRASQALQHGEARAATKAYERNRGWLAGCGHPASQYGFGSGGLFAMLPTYALSQFRGSRLACASPFEVFDPAFSLAAAYGFARGLTQREGYLGTWASLRSGWGLPSKIGDRARIEKKSPKWRKHLRAIGLPETRLTSSAPAFPRRDLSEMYASMGGRL